MNKVIVFLGIVLFFVSCKNDDDLDIETVPPRSLSEVAAENDQEIREYLETHFYNYEEFQTPPADFDFKIVIDTIAGENADKDPMIDFVEMETITVTSADVARTNEDESVPHTLYYLIARQGTGENPTYADNTVLTYEGMLVSENLFDASSTPTLQYLPQTIRGYQRAVTQLKTGDGPFENGDGTVSYEGFGVGMVIIPSGLGYFDQLRSGIPAYSSLIFKLDVLSYIPDTDFDGDGIPSIMEDLDGDGNLNNDNTDGDFTPAGPLANHVDTDDDGDGIPTRDEIVIDESGNITFPDTDGDGTPDYLDSDS